MPRFLSAVTILSSFFPTVWTQTWRTLLVSGASQARRAPSGESAGEVRSGLPKRISRGMSGGRAAWTTLITANTNPPERIMGKSDFIRIRGWPMHSDNAEGEACQGASGGGMVRDRGCGDGGGDPEPKHI